MPHPAWGGSSYPWVSGHVLGFIIVGAVCLIAFGLYGKPNVLLLTKESLTRTQNLLLHWRHRYFP